MNTNVSDAGSCPNCGKPLAKGALAGLCPCCLLQNDLTQPDAPKAASRFEPPAIEAIAKLFPQLEILGLLGAGGMGAVYKARQPVLDRVVALKVLPVTASEAGNFPERFNREARALARLSHPNIIAVYEFGSVEGLHFFLMEFVDGVNLRQLERAGRLSPREALQLIPQICDALQFAHDEGVVHRDIKPENVLVDRKGRVKIADFGLARIVGQDAESLRLTREGQIMGTPHYMAPEQVQHPLSVDHRADIYSLGVVLYEMLTGELPLGHFAPPSRKVQVDVRFDEVVLRALENDPARRYQQVSEVKTQVETIASTPPSPGSAPQQSFVSWLGFAVVREGPNGRSVNWKPTLIALAVSFAIVSLLFGAVTAVTGRSWMGWVGVVGWKSVVARLLLSLAVVGWGVRRALDSSQKPKAASLAANGTVILDSVRPGWRMGRRLAFVAIAVVAWLNFQISWLTPWLRSERGRTRRIHVAVREPERGARIAKLPGGGSFELLALAEADVTPRQWWLPDGEFLANKTFEVHGPADMLVSDAIKRELAFRISGLPREAEPLVYDFKPAASISVGGDVLQDGERIPGGWPMRAAWPNSTRSASIRIGYSVEPWRTITTHDQVQYTSTRNSEAGDPDWTAGINHVSDDGSDTLVTVLLGPESEDWRMRVIAIGHDGTPHSHQRASGTPSSTSTTWTLTFAGLTKADIKEFQVQVRPTSWVDFGDVALYPRGSLQSKPSSKTP